MTEYDDFQEIAHSGGLMIFNVRSDAEGGISIQSGWKHERRGPAALVGLYADLNSGRVVSGFQVLGIGVPFDPPPPEGALAVWLGSDSRAKWGHQCPRCSTYFRSGNNSGLFPLTCVRCGFCAPAHVFLTPAQKRYVSHIIGEVQSAIQNLNKGEELKIEINLDLVGDKESAEPKPDFYYAEQKQQTEFNCNHCGEYNDVRGRFAYCGSCGWRNNRDDFQRRCADIRDRLNSETIPAATALREIVSEFDACCRDYALQLTKRMPMKPYRRIALQKAFHDADGVAVQTMKEAADIDIRRDLDAAELRFFQMMFHRRHVHEHLGGVADNHYCTHSGDQLVTEGELLREDRGEIHKLISLLSRMVENLDSQFHEIFPPTEMPIKQYVERQERLKKAGID